MCSYISCNICREINASIRMIYSTLQRPLKKGETRSQLVDAFCNAITVDGPYAHCLHYLNNVSMAKNIVLCSEWGMVIVLVLVQASLDAGLLLPDADRGLFIFDRSLMTFVIHSFNACRFWSSCVVEELRRAMRFA